MTRLNHRANSWLPKKAAEYAAQLISIKGMKSVRRYSSSSVGDVTFNNKLSKRLLLDPRMKEVWKYFCGIHEDCNWLDFLAEVQFAVKGPGSVRSPDTKKRELTALEDAFTEIERISKRNGIDIAQTPVGFFFNSPNLESILDESDEVYAVRGGNDQVTLRQYFDELKGLISRRQELIKKPNHKDILYQYFVRRAYLYFKERTNQSNQWKILSIIASVSLEMDISQERVRGTCKDLKDLV